MFQTDESRMVTQYHFTAWPDHGVPDAFQLLQFFRKVTENATEYDVAPTVVHCRLVASDQILTNRERNFFLFMVRNCFSQ